MLELARTRTAGAHPYLVTPEHSRIAREALGPDALVATEQGVVLETDPERARTIARLHLATYLGLPNYANNWMRLGFTDGRRRRRRQRPPRRRPRRLGDEDDDRRRVSRSTATPAPATCASRCSPTTRVGFPLEQWRALAPALTR